LSRTSAGDVDAPKSLTDILRPVQIVAPSMPVLDLLLQMREKRQHMALVIDEFGGIDGLVTIEDLVEEIVGDIEDEHDDEAAAGMIPLPGGGWDVDARTELEDVAETIDPRLGEVEEDVDTLGGLAFLLAGHVPAIGEVVEHDSGWRLEVTDGDSRRITRLTLHPPAEREAMTEHE
jgi:CBS domain containing-hemolysin-like protein